MDKYSLYFQELFLNWGFSQNNVLIYSTITLLSIIAIMCFLSYRITKYGIIVLLKKVIHKSKNEFDDILIKRKVFDYLSHIIPALIIYFTISYAIPNEAYHNFLQSLTYLYMVVAVVLVINQFLNALSEIFELVAEKRQLNVSIKGYIQVAKILMVIIALILIISVIINEKPGAIFAGLGAMTAILLLIFKDTILGFVASIQLSAYQMLKVGDWITMSSRNADGDVIDISLTTVKVQNFDKTISTIPTYALVSESFTNWHGMQMAGGRRISRSIYIDINSIKFCSSEMLDNFKKIHYLTNYINEKQKELEDWNKEKGIDNSVVVNGKRLTNLGVFRIYIENYLKDNFRIYRKFEKKIISLDDHEMERFYIPDPKKLVEELGEGVNSFLQVIKGYTVIADIDKFLREYNEKFILENNRVYYIRKIKNVSIKKEVEVEIEKYEKIEERDGLFSDDMTFLVRPLAPTETGVPIQVYVFAATTNWAEYEKIQADLFDHLFAIIPEFGLKVFQEPTGGDFKRIMN